MNYIEKALISIKILGLKSSRSQLENLMSYGKGELFVLNYLYFRNEAITPTELTNALGTTTARISAILKILEKKEEIFRETDKTNRNHVLVTLTDKGCSRAEKIVHTLNDTMTAVFTDMGEEDTMQFLQLANRFLDTLEQHPINLK